MAGKFPSPDAWRRALATVCKKERITVEYMSAVATPHCIRNDDGSFTLRLNPPDGTDPHWLGKAFHEITHPLTEWTYDVIKLLPEGHRIAMDIANVFADYIGEHAKHGRYDGMDRAISTMREGMSMYKELGKGEHPVTPLMYLDVEARARWQCAIKTHPMQPMYTGVYDKLRTHRGGVYEYLEEIEKRKDPKALAQLVIEVLYILAGKEPPKEGEGDKGEGGGKGKGKPGEGDSGEKGESPETPNTESGDGDKSGETEGQPGDKGSGEPPNGDKQGTDHMGTGQKPSDLPDLPEDGTSMLPADYARLEDTAEERTDDTKRSRWSEEWYVPFENHQHIVPNYMPYPDTRERIVGHLTGSTISKRIRKHLKIISKDGYTYGHTTGKLHSKNMHRIYSGASDQPRIFKRKDHTILKTNSAVMIMLDCSGSMRHGEYDVGAACCVALSRCLTELRIPHEILGFTEYGLLMTYHFKDFSQNVSQSKLIDGFASSNIRLIENADGESIMYGAERLMQRKEKHKMMIVLSDGEPCGTYTGNGDWYLKKVCTMIEAAGVDLMGIGIDTTAVKRYYSRHHVVRKLSDLDAVLFDHLSKSLTR